MCENDKSEKRIEEALRHRDRRKRAKFEVGQKVELIESLQICVNNRDQVIKEKEMKIFALEELVKHLKSEIKSKNTCLKLHEELKISSGDSRTSHLHNRDAIHAADLEQVCKQAELGTKRALSKHNSREDTEEMSYLYQPTILPIPFEFPKKLRAQFIGGSLNSTKWK